MTAKNDKSAERNSKNRIPAVGVNAPVRCAEKARDLEALTFSIAHRFYSFLLRHHREDVAALARSMKFIVGGRANIGEASRIIQRHLYRAAKECGWRRNVTWTHPEKSVSFQTKQEEAYIIGNRINDGKETIETEINKTKEA